MSELEHSLSSWGMSSRVFREFVDRSRRSREVDLKRDLLERLQPDPASASAVKREQPPAVGVFLYRAWGPERDVFRRFSSTRAAGSQTEEMPVPAVSGEAVSAAGAPGEDLARAFHEERGAHRIEAGEVTAERLACCRLYDLSALGRADVVRVGRGDPGYFEERGLSYRNDIQVDALRVDGRDTIYVSREHGLVVLDGERLYYVDFGSIQARAAGRDPGSRNGTVLLGRGKIRHAAVRCGADDIILLPSLDPAYLLVFRWEEE